MAAPFNKKEGYRELLRNKNFLFLWLGQVFSQLGDRVTFVIFVAIIAHAFGTSTSVQSWLYVAFTIPAILLTAIAGVFVDKWNKKSILIISNIARAIFIGLMPFFDSSLIGIYAIAFLVSCATQFFTPAEASFIPAIVDKKQLLSANSLFTTTMMASIIFGFVLGDPIINIFSLKSSHMAVSGLFIISTLCLIFIKFKPIKIEEKSKTLKTFFCELKEGFRYIKNHKIILNTMLMLTALFSIIVMMSILAIGISQQLLYLDNPTLGSQKFAYIISFSGIGMVIGSIFIGKVFKNINKYFLIFSGFVSIGINLLLFTSLGLISNDYHFYFPGFVYNNIHLDPFSLTYRMIYSYIIAGLVGFSSAFVAVPVQTILHKNIKPKVRGKVFGVQFTLLSTASTLPVLVAAFGADSFGIEIMLFIIGLPTLFLGIYGFYKTKMLNKVFK